ncbi:MAG: hypothetical protein DCC75_04485 [Proteobacteria bacterium]|nr:MAG: hypothetical protein DCC75_04485 [Pseudomonadota bacterium]
MSNSHKETLAALLAAASLITSTTFAQDLSPRCEAIQGQITRLSRGQEAIDANSKLPQKAKAALKSKLDKKAAKLARVAKRLCPEQESNSQMVLRSGPQCRMDDFRCGPGGTYGDMILFRSVTHHISDLADGSGCATIAVAAGETIYDDRVALYSLSDPDHPYVKFVGFGEEDWYTSALAIRTLPSRQTLLAMGGSGRVSRPRPDYGSPAAVVSFVDVTDINNPAKISEVGLPDTAGQHQDIYNGPPASGDYISDSRFLMIGNYSNAAARAHVIDISNPSAPQIIRSLDLPALRDRQSGEILSSEAYNCIKTGRLGINLTCVDGQMFRGAMYSPSSNFLHTWQSVVFPQMIPAESSVSWNPDPRAIKNGTNVVANAMVAHGDVLYLARTSAVAYNAPAPKPAGIYAFRLNPAGKPFQYLGFYKISDVSGSIHRPFTNIWKIEKNGEVLLHAVITSSEEGYQRPKHALYKINPDGSLEFRGNPIIPGDHSNTPHGGAFSIVDNRLYAFGGGYGVTYDYSNPLLPRRIGRIADCWAGDHGDMNLDERIDCDDKAPFYQALLSPTEYYVAYPDGWVGNADMNFDGAVDLNDEQPFLDRIGDCP